MARKSRKHPNIADNIKQSRDTVGYIRLSVRNTDFSNSIENQKLLIEEWSHQDQTPIMHYYIDSGFSGRRFDRPSFQQLIQDIQDGKIECIIVKDDCVIIELNAESPIKCGFCAVSSIF